MRGYAAVALRRALYATSAPASRRSATGSALLPSRRTVGSELRTRAQLHTVRVAVSVEASSLRYALVTESSLPQGWDEGICQEDEDGT
eukprot:scaffold69290_cov45-Attheya_sp.AAC.1